MTEKGTKELYLQLSRHNAVTAGAVCVADIAGIYGVNAMECDAIGTIEIARIMPGKWQKRTVSRRNRTEDPECAPGIYADIFRRSGTDTGISKAWETTGSQGFRLESFGQ